MFSNMCEYTSLKQVCKHVDEVKSTKGQFHCIKKTELQIGDFGLLFNHFVLYSYDLSQFEYFYKVERYPMPSLETQNLSKFSLV